MAQSSYLTLFFPHAGWGQSVLVKTPAGWLVIDANHSVGLDNNPTLQILRHYAQDHSFKIIAIIVTHFHTDHYSGITDVLDFCANLARKRKSTLGETVGSLILPQTFPLYHRFVKESAAQKARPSLAKFLARLQQLHRENRTGTLSHNSFGWTSSGKTQPGSSDAWFFTYHPSPSEVIAGLWRGADRALAVPAENDSCYVLGVGSGSHSGSLHVLLTSDVPGHVFANLTRELRTKVLPAVTRKQAGAPLAMQALLQSGAPRLRAVQALTVPHHGSGVQPALASELSWWLGEPRPQRPIAVVQGGVFALKENTLDELFRVRLRVFATTEPRSIKARSGHTGCTDLDERLIPSLPSRPSAERTPRTKIMEAQPFYPETAHLALSGGMDGLHRVRGRSVYEILPRSFPRRPRTDKGAVRASRESR